MWMSPICAICFAKGWYRVIAPSLDFHGLGVGSTSQERKWVGGEGEERGGKGGQWGAGGWAAMGSRDSGPSSSHTPKSGPCWPCRPHSCLAALLPPAPVPPLPLHFPYGELMWSPRAQWEWWAQHRQYRLSRYNIGPIQVSRGLIWASTGDMGLIQANRGDVGLIQLDLSWWGWCEPNMDQQGGGGKEWGNPGTYTPVRVNKLGRHGANLAVLNYASTHQLSSCKSELCMLREGINTACGGFQHVLTLMM